MANLTGQNIKDTYQQLVTLGSGTTITNGTGSQITDLAVTASWASNAVTASYALNAGVTVDTGSLMVTGSVSGNVLTFTKGDGSAFNLTVDTGSAGVSASYADYAANAGALDGTPASGYARLIVNNTFSGTNTFEDGIIANVISAQYAGVDGPDITINPYPTGKLVVSGGGEYEKDVAITGSLRVQATSSLNRIQAVGSEIFVDDKVVITSGDLNVEAGNVLVSVGDVTVLTGSLVANTLQGVITNPLLISAAGGVNINSGIAMTVTASAVNLTGGLNAAGGITGSLLGTATSASYASNADLLDGLNSTAFAQVSQNNSFSGLQTFNNIAVNGTASIAYLQAVTGSAKIIGDAYIILNNDTPAERYAGIKVIDSGSANVTASLLFDGQTNDWFYEYESGDPTNFGVVLFGPEYGTLGVPSYPQANQIQKGTGGHHLTGSALSDDGTKVTVATSLESLNHISALGYISAGGGFTGSLNGNADTATSASHALYANQAGTATSASFATTALSASYAPAGATPTLQEVSTAGATTNQILVNNNPGGGAGYSWWFGAHHLMYNTSDVPVGQWVYNGAGITGAEIQLGGLASTPLVLDHNTTGLYLQSQKVDLNTGGAAGKAIVYNGSNNTAEWGTPASASFATTASYATYAVTANSASYAPHTQGLIQGNSGDAGSLRSFIAGGASSVASGSDAVSIGNSATANGYQAVAIGGTANAPEFASTAVGGYSKAEATLAVAVGNGATIRSYGGVGVGPSTEAEGGQYATAIGYAAKAYGDNTIAIGRGAITAYPEAGQIVIGRSTSTGANEIIIGSGSTSYGANTVHIGNASITDTYLEGVIHGNGASITGVVSASYALSARVFPYTGSAEISGSLTVRGSENVNLIVSSSTSNVFGAGPVIGGHGGTTYFVSRAGSVGGSGNMKVEAGRDLNIDVDTQYHLITHKNSTSGDTYWTDNGTGDFQIRGNSVSKSGSLWWKPSTAGQAGLKVEKIPTQVQLADWSQNTSDWVNWLTIPANSTANPNPSVQFKRSVEVTGSLNVSGGITGSLSGAATLAFNNNTASGSIGFWQGSQTEYNAISGSASNSIIYFII